MTHQDYKDLIHLSFLQELSEDEQSVLEEHLRDCPECGAEAGELKHLHEVIGRHSGGDITDDLLFQARRELRVALRLERAKKTRWIDLLERFNIMSYPTVRVAFASAAMLVIGLGLGYLLFVPTTSVTSVGEAGSLQGADSQSGATKVSNLRFISQQTETGEVEFTFEMVTPIRMRGSVRDNVVQRVLAQALLNEQNPGARLQTVSTLGTQLQPAALQDHEIKRSLIRALKADPNVGVRREALLTLQKLPLDEEVKQAFLYVLRHETNPAMRIDVINSLEKPVLAGKMIDKDILDVLREKMQTDENNYVRARARNVYEEGQQR
ncbi:MAG: hypothetical protein FJ217_03370 [Ignavibacteria bacterium]|nr:hypothetical protein [Ignavibacteria bacterium]